MLASLVRGAVAGTAATAAMSGLMLGSRRLGFSERQAPEEVVRRAGDLVGAEPQGRTADALASLAHLGFGAGCGALHALLPRVGPAPARGAALGLVVYAASYEGWVPAMGAMPPAHRDARDRQAVLLAAHVVYGLVLGVLEERWRRARR